MTFTDYLLNGLLIALVVLQVRGRKLTQRNFLLPIVVVAIAAYEYLPGLPSGAANLALVAGGAAAGLVLGTGAGLATRVFRRADGSTMAKTAVVGAALWIVGVGARLAFELYATHGGGPSIARFSAAHHLTITAWVAALVLMALAEVAGRSAAIGVKWLRLGATGRQDRIDPAERWAVPETGQA